MCPQRVLKAKIGELLIERNLISRKQLDIALGEQKEKGGYISQHLISLGFVSEINIAECLVSQYGFAYLPVARYEIASQILKIIPFKLVNIYSLLPIEKNGNSLNVAMADPLNEGVIDMLRQVTGCDIQVFISAYSEIRQAIDNYFHAEIQNTDQKSLDAEVLIKEEMLKPFIQVKGYGAGTEKRKYKRKDVDLDMVYFFQDRSCKAKIKNISYGGVLFATGLFIPMSLLQNTFRFPDAVSSLSIFRVLLHGSRRRFWAVSARKEFCNRPPIEKNIYTNIVCKIFAQNVTINAVVQVVRVEKTGEAQYNIAGFFNFITDNDRIKLTLLLR